MHLEKFVIDSSKPTHLGWWANYFEVSDQALLAAIEAVGAQALAVHLYLHNQGRTQPSVSARRTEEEQSQE